MLVTGLTILKMNVCLHFLLMAANTWPSLQHMNGVTQVQYNDTQHQIKKLCITHA